MHERRYDAAVIGAGLGGLAAAHELARSGLKTILIEQHNLPGGYATSFVRGRFEFEPSLHEIGTAGLGEERMGLRKYFIEEIGAGIEFHRVPEAYRLILTERGLDVSVPFGMEAFTETVADIVPGSRKKLMEYMELCGTVMKALDYLGKSGKDIDRKRLLEEYGDFVRTVPYTMKDVAHSMNLPRELTDIIYPYFCYLGVPESRLSFTIWAAMLYSYVSYGAVVPAMRSHELSSALLSKFEEAGGIFAPNTRVTELLLENGAARGLRTSRGETLRVSGIVSNASPTLVYGTLATPRSEVPLRALKNVNARIPGVSAFVVYLGLDAPPEKLGIGKYGYFISEHMDTDRIYATLSHLGTPVMQASVCLNNAVPGCSPPGTTILSLTTVFRSEAWRTVGQEHYFETKHRIAEAMIRRFEQATGSAIRPHIEEMEIATPQTFARYTGAHDGNVYAWEPEPWDSIIPRAMAEDEERYVKGLYFGGGYGYRCHGYGGSVFSGRKAAADLVGYLAGGAR